MATTRRDLPSLDGAAFQVCGNSVSQGRSKGRIAPSANPHALDARTHKPIRTRLPMADGLRILHESKVEQAECK